MSEFVAQEFSAISVSTYDSASLATRLTERSAEGWSVVSIVQTGTTVTAFLARPVGSAATPAATATGATTGAISESTPEPATTVGAVASTAAATATIGTDSAATSSAATNSAGTNGVGVDSGTGEPTAAAAPAGWYADPAKRFELRYWDGTTWTEYVSRAGQQFTDPPVA